MCGYISVGDDADRRRRPGHAARRRAAARGHRLDTADVVGRLLLRRREPGPQVGPGARDDSLRAGAERGRPERHEDPATRHRQDAPADRRRRHGHAAHAGRPRTGRLRRGLEPDAPGQGAGHPAPLRRGGLGLHHHQHLRRVADHAEPPRPRRRRRRGEQGRGRDRARGVRRQARLRARRRRPVRRPDGAVRRLHRGAGARRLQRAGPGPRRRRRRRDHHRDDDLARGAAARRSRRPRPPARRASSARWPTT